MNTAPSTESAYASSVAVVADMTAKITSEIERHRAAVAKLVQVRSRAQSVIDFAERGGNPDDFAVAARVLELEWRREPGTNQRIGDRPYTGPVHVTAEVDVSINSAIQSLREGGASLTRQYFGIKSYDAWDSQIENHPYGYGPKHGSIWFRIGFQPPYRNPDNLPTEDERLACIRYLAAIRDNPALMGGAR